MRHAPSTLHFTYAFHAALPQGSIEWEELPSLAQPVRQREATSVGAPAPWDSTRPASLDRASPSPPSPDPFPGVAVRWVPIAALDGYRLTPAALAVIAKARA